MVALLAPLCILAVALASPLHIIYSSFAPSSPQSLRIHAIAAANQTGKATAEPFFTNGKDWRTTATIGGQELRLWLDTGSSDLWVYGSTIPANDTEGHMLFDPSQSPTFQNVSDSSWAVAYVGNMGASGYWGTDTVTVGGVTVQGQTVEVANRIFGVRENFNGADGILGLGFNGSQGGRLSNSSLYLLFSSSSSLSILHSLSHRGYSLERTTKANTSKPPAAPIPPSPTPPSPLSPSPSSPSTSTTPRPAPSSSATSTTPSTRAA